MTQKRLAKKIAMEVAYLSSRPIVAPEFLSLITTFHCNFRCQSCSIWQKNDFDELSLEQWLPILEDFKADLAPTTFVEINGGEPLIRKTLVLGLIKSLKSYFKTIALNTNGSLINQETINQLEDAGLDILKLSFYSLDKNIHNQLRGDDSAFDQAKKTIDLMQEKKIRLEIGILITKQNIDGLPDLINYLNQLPNATIILQPLDEKIESDESKNIKANNLISDLWPSNNQTQIFFDWLAGQDKTGRQIKNSANNLSLMRRYYLEPSSILAYRCFSGQRNLTVYPNGELALCFKRQTIGNLNNQKIKNILSSKSALDERQKIKSCQKYCRIIGCNFSRGFKEIFLK